MKNGKFIEIVSTAGIFGVKIICNVFRKHLQFSFQVDATERKTLKKTNQLQFISSERIVLKYETIEIY